MTPAMSTNEDLLKLEHGRSTSSASESPLLVCKKESLTEFSKHQSSDGKLVTSVPTSNVLGKVKDFLEVMAESNRKLQDNAVISELTQFPALRLQDLLLGVADLHTPEAVAAAESSILGSHSAVDLAVAASDSVTEDSNSCSSDNEDDDDNDNDDHEQTFSSHKSQRSCSSGDDQAKKRLMIQEL
ncbi:hypothetical protein Scep_029955 [Stephania cephalantha]|uniref:Uncharacterized protein n=1 Tax=Stephania cephalantha TaxID=152367 RepID=A0AAP0E6E3_9MAGN